MELTAWWQVIAKSSIHRSAQTSASEPIKNSKRFSSFSSRRASRPFIYLVVKYYEMWISPSAQLFGPGRNFINKAITCENKTFFCIFLANDVCSYRTNAKGKPSNKINNFSSRVLDSHSLVDSFKYGSIFSIKFHFTCQSVESRVFYAFFVVWPHNVSLMLIKSYSSRKGFSFFLAACVTHNIINKCQNCCSQMSKQVCFTLALQLATKQTWKADERVTSIERFK